MTTSPLTAASLLPLTAAAPRQGAGIAGSNASSALDAAAALEGASADSTDLLGSVNALQSLASLLGGGSTTAASTTSTFQPTIPPYKPIAPIDQKTIRDSIPDDDGSSAAAGA